jgi:hypothetical protein
MSIFDQRRLTNATFKLDVVRARLHGEWVDPAKTGRAPGQNPDLEPVDLEAL